MYQHTGKQTLLFSRPAYISQTAAIGGKKEGDGPLSSSFDDISPDDHFGEDSWEKAESELQRRCAGRVMRKARIREEDIDYILAGDLINQCVGANYAMKDLNISFFGLYGACSTMAEALTLGAVLISGGFARHVLSITSSHFCTAEKQFRFPLAYGGQRTPTSQWTVTASGAAILSDSGEGAKITGVTTGRIVDMGITDANNMGAAMAPAACDTLITHFKDTGRTPDQYDLILTGDLGVVGSDILCDMMNKRGYDIYSRHKDAGKMIFDMKTQDVHAGGSGCGCFASVLCGHIMNEMKQGHIKKVLAAATGALMNTMTVQQGSSIPAIAHAVVIEA